MMVARETLPATTEQQEKEERRPRPYSKLLGLHVKGNIDRKISWLIGRVLYTADTNKRKETIDQQMSGLLFLPHKGLHTGFTGCQTKASGSTSTGSNRCGNSEDEKC
jgi:hypothetical protein